MDAEFSLLTWLNTNKEWVFSGIGIAVISGLIALLWLHPAKRPATAEVASASPTTVPTFFEPQVEMREGKLRSCFVKKSITVGDFYDFTSDFTRDPVRVKLKDIRTEDIPSPGDTPKPVLVADVEISTQSQSPLACGRRVKRIDQGNDKFLVPALDIREEESSVYSFGNSKSMAHFFRLYVDHINPQGRTVDIHFLTYLVFYENNKAAR